MRSKERSTRVIFVRHGKTDFPIDRIYCDDKIDPELNDEGIMQARSMAHYFANIKLSAVFSSPAARTLMTAREIAKVTRNEITLNQALRERRFGVWEGQFFDEVEKNHPNEYAKWKQDKIFYTPSGGEAIPEFQARVCGCVERLTHDYIDETIVIVTHVGAIRMAVTKAMHIPLTEYRQINVAYASITTIDYGVSKNNLLNLNIIRYSD